jgi:hypothetical protein
MIVSPVVRGASHHARLGFLNDRTKLPARVGLFRPRCAALQGGMMKYLILSLAWVLASVDLARADAAFLCDSNGRRIQQLRIYEVNRDNRDPFHQRFQDHALRIMQRHQFEIVDLWESETGEKLQLIYLLSWPDAAMMDARWKAFLADPEWIEIKKRTAAEHGELVRSANGQPLRRLSYSPKCSRRLQ